MWTRKLLKSAQDTQPLRCCVFPKGLLLLCTYSKSTQNIVNMGGRRRSTTVPTPLTSTPTTSITATPTPAPTSTTFVAPTSTAPTVSAASTVPAALNASAASTVSAPPPAPASATAKKPPAVARMVWELDDELLLLQEIRAKGKGKWAQILKAIHDRHRLTAEIPMEDADKLRTKYNDLKNPTKSKFLKPYIPPPTPHIPRRGKTAQEIRKKEEEIANQNRHEELQLLEGKRLIEEIEEREQRRAADDVKDKSKEEELMAEVCV